MLSCVQVFLYVILIQRYHAILTIVFIFMCHLIITSSERLVLLSFNNILLIFMCHLLITNSECLVLLSFDNTFLNTNMSPPQRCKDARSNHCPLVSIRPFETFINPWASTVDGSEIPNRICLGIFFLHGVVSCEVVSRPIGPMLSLYDISYIYLLHLVDFDGVHVCKYTIVPWMLWEMFFFPNPRIW